MFTTFAGQALESWTRTVYPQRRRGRMYFGSLGFWLVLVPLFLILQVMVFGAGVAVILVAQLVVWLLDAVTLGRAGLLVGKLADLSTSGSFDQAREQSLKRWNK